MTTSSNELVAQVKGIWQTNMDEPALFEQLILPLLPSIVQHFLQAMEHVRNDSQLVQEDLQFLAHACKLEPTFAAQYEQHVQQFYKTRASALIHTHSVVQFMKLVLQFLKQEQEWCGVWNLDEKVYGEAAKRAIYEQMIDNYKQHLAAASVTLLYQQVKDVMSRVPAASTFLRHMVTDDCAVRLQCIMSSKYTYTMSERVQNLVELRWYYEQFLCDCFVDELNGSRNKEYAKAISKLFDDLCNQIDDIATILVALVHSCILKHESKEMMELVMDKTILFMHHVPNKLVLKKKCIEFLEKRCLPNSGAKNIDIEYLFCSKLNSSFGQVLFHAMTAMESMLSDMTLSITTTSLWQEHCAKENVSTDILSVSLVSGTCWPCTSEATTKVPLASHISEACSEFSSFFRNTNPSKQLTWLPHLGTVHLRWNGCDKPYELVVSPFQMQILLQFNDCDSLSIQEIARCTNLPSSIISNAIIPLTMPIFGPSSNVLQINSQLDKEIIVHVNISFSSSKFRITVPSEAKDSEETLRKVKVALEKLEHEQNTNIDSCIVRVMMTRRKMDLIPLFNEVSNRLSNYFVVTMKQLKKRIESLIEREYLQRDGIGMLEYLA